LPRLWVTSEPTAGKIGALAREFLKGRAECRPETLARLFAADRCEHLYGKDGIIAHCERGELVVCDRYVPSSLVYQGLECGEALPAALNKDFPAPALLLFFDLDCAVSEARIAGRSQRDIFEYPAFQERARARYRAVLEQYRRDGKIVEVVDAGRTREAVAQDVLTAIRKLPIGKG
jgi:dTMP kinase